MKILITCPPMLRMISAFRPIFDARSIEITTPDVVQTLTEQELIKLVPDHDGWIIGDDPATRAVFTAGRCGKLRAAVKWGIGVDNVDSQACADLGIPITRTPNMFGAEVADIAMGYMIGLARETFAIDRGVRAGQWPKPRGISLGGKTLALVGYGDIGRNVARRAMAADLNVVAYDPAIDVTTVPSSVQVAEWPERIGEADFIVLTCALTKANRHMLDHAVLAATKPGVRIVNVARGPLIDEAALVVSLQNGHVHSAALDVFESEPLPDSSPLRSMERCIFGSHNASNTEDAVIRASERAIAALFEFLKIS